jgi:hypothetical protein
MEVRNKRRTFFRLIRPSLGNAENPASITFVFQDITNWKKGTEHINGLELFFKDRDHLSEKWETLNPDGTKTHFEFELTRKSGK